MSKKVGSILNLIIILSMVLTLCVINPASPAAARQDPTPPVPAGKTTARTAGSEEVQPIEKISKEAALQKIDPSLREAAINGGVDEVELYVSISGAANLDKFLRDVIVRPVVLNGIRNVYGKAYASDLIRIAQEQSVVALVNVSVEDLRDKPYDPEKEDLPDRALNPTRLDELRANELTYSQAQEKAGKEDVKAAGWFDVLDGHKSKEAWKKGFTGKGVVVGIIDDGVDFAHPDLQGTYARVTDENSPYYGWPMAFSQVSTRYFASDVILGSNLIASGGNGSRWTDAQTTVEIHPDFEGGRVGKAMYQPLGSSIAHEYTIPVTSMSSRYKLGSFPEKNLLAIYQERVAVLVVDENEAGVYDTVYVDLDNDYDFTDEKPATKESPEIYRDMNGDGYADISGGILVWISDGANPPPTADYLWGITCAKSSETMAGCPDSGNLVLFAGPFDAGYTHGTQCASNVAGQGKVNGGLSAQPFAIGGMVQGAAPDVGIMDFGNHYYPGTDEDEYLVAAIGYDGIPMSGDEVQITSNSYGSFGQMWGGWGYIGRLITTINLTIAPSTVWVFSGGNEGPGYGPQEGEAGPTILKAGSSTQYGSTNWDSIASMDQIVYGDPSSFGAKGPNRDGSAGLDILGNGGRGAGDEGLNYFGFDGATSWATWGGTSRSAPVVAGNLALVFQAYKARYGRWPTWEKALALLKSGATNSVSSPFLQGAGVVNADRSTDLAAGIYGVYAQPDEWQVGDWQGNQYMNFAKVAFPGDAKTQTFMVTNPSGYNMKVGLSDGMMTLTDKKEYTLTTNHWSQESGVNFYAPDYLMKLPKADIPVDAEVMFVRYVHSYDTFNPTYDFSGTPNSSWRFLLYNWTDQNGDGRLWTDNYFGPGPNGFIMPGNGVVNHNNLPVYDNDGLNRVNFANSEIQQGEYVRMDYEFGGIGIPIIVHDPLKRMGDGYFFGFQHRRNDGTIPQTTFKIGVEFYKRADWPWLSLSNSSLMVPPEGMASFDATMNVPQSAKPGIYEGMIFMKDPGKGGRAPHESAIPVVVNVIADLPDGGAVTMGGTPMANTMYQNSWTNGYFNWYGGGWVGAGDWRHYFLNVDQNDLTSKNLLVHTHWNDGYPTDLNTWVLGPTPDCASNGSSPCAWYAGLLGQPYPDVFGPYTLQPIAASEPFRAGAVYPFNTSTGGPDDWLKVPLDTTGLHEIALHNVLYSGKNLAAQFQVDVGTIKLDAVMDPRVGKATVGSVNAKAYADTGEINLLFTPTLALPDLNVGLSGGLSTTSYGPFTSFVVDNGQAYTPWNPANTVEMITLDVPGATKLHVHLYMPDSQDADLFLVYDKNGNTILDQGIDTIVGISGNSTGVDEDIVVNNPALGNYFVVIAGYDVEPNSGVSLDWEYDVTASGPLPTQPMEIFSNTVTINQDVTLDPTTSSYSMTITTDERTATIHALLSNLPYGSDADLYLTDETGALVAQSQNRSNTDEEIPFTPPDGNYRFTPGSVFTLWVHGFNIPTPPITPHLHVWEDANNLWLSAEHPDVHVSAISAGETVTVTLNFEKESWMPGDPDLSARLLASPSVLPNAFDELVTISRSDAPVAMPDIQIEKTGMGERGSSVYLYNTPYGASRGVLIAPGDLVTYTLTMTNTGTVTGKYYIEDYWGNDRVLFQNWVAGAEPAGSGTYVAGPWFTLWLTDTLEPGETKSFSYVGLGNSLLIDRAYGTYVDAYDYDTGIPYADKGVLVNHYQSFDVLGSLGSVKVSNPNMVAPGGTFAYILNLANPSAQDKDLYVWDPLPKEVNFLAGFTPGVNYDPGTHTVSWTGKVKGTTLSYTPVIFLVQVKPTIVEGTEIQNEAMISTKFQGPINNTISTHTLVDDGKNPLLQVDKMVSRLTGNIGDVTHPLLFTINVYNAGAETAVNATIADMVPPFLTVIPGSVTGGAFPYQGMLVWMGDINPGDTVTITFMAVINQYAWVGLAVINPAVAFADNFPRMAYGSSITEVIPKTKVWVPYKQK